MVAKKNYEVLPTQQAYRVIAEKCPVINDAGTLDEGAEAQQIRETIITNDFNVTWTTGNPGDVIPYHTHMPSLYQVLITLEGECVWHYKGNNGEEKSIKAGPGELIFLPGGAENKVEIVGDESHTHIGIYPKVPIPRLEQVTGEAQNTYDPWELTNNHVGLRYDTDNDEIRHLDEDAVSAE